MKLHAIIGLAATLSMVLTNAHAYEDLTDEWRSSVETNNIYTAQPERVKQKAPKPPQSKWRSSIDVRNNVPNVRIERASKNAQGRESKVSFIKSSTRLGANYKGAFDIGVKGTRNGFKVDLGKGW